LLLQVLVGELQFADGVAHSLQPVIASFDLILLLAQLAHQFSIVSFGLIERLLQSGISGLSAPHLLFDALQFRHTGVELCAESVALLLQSFAFLFESLQSETQCLVFLVAALVLVFGLFNLEPDCLALSSSSVALSFQSAVLAEEVLNDKVRLLQLDTVVIDLGPQLKRSPLVDLKLVPK